MDSSPEQYLRARNWKREKDIGKSRMWRSGSGSFYLRENAAVLTQQKIDAERGG